jgi:hypothetical protein
MIDFMTKTIGFRPTPVENDILTRAAADGLTSSDAIRRGLALLDRDMWWRQARADMERLADEGLTSEPDAW